MSERNKKSLVERYYTWEKLVLGTSLLLIFWRVFGLIDTTTLPLLNAVLHDPNKFPHATCIILSIEFLYMWIAWGQSDEAARQDTLSRIGFCVTFALAFFAVWINTPALTKGTALEGVSGFWYIFYFFIGLTIAFFSSIIVLATLMIRTEEKGKGFPLSYIPVATRCIYRADWPVIILVLVLSLAGSCYAPFAVLQVAPWITFLPISIVFIGDIIRYFFVYDEYGKRIPFRQNISKLKEAFKTHDYIYFLHGRNKQLDENVKEVLLPNATPQEQQKAIQQHYSKDSGNTTLRTRTLEEFRFRNYSKDGNPNNQNPSNKGIRVILENPKAAGLRVEIWPKDENPPKTIKQLVLKVCYLEKHANEFLQKNSSRDFTVKELFSYTVDRSVEDTCMEEACNGFPLHNAAFVGRQDLVEQFLAKGKDLNERDPIGWTPLLHAVANGYPKIVKLLLERGSNPDISNLKKITPLMYAARYGNLEITKMLLDFGATLDLEDIYGETALVVAVRTDQESLVKLFISKGAKIDTRSKLKNQSPLDLAHQLGYGKIARLLRKQRTKP